MDVGDFRKYSKSLEQQTTNENIPKTEEANKHPFQRYNKQDYKEKSSLALTGDDTQTNPNQEKTNYADSLSAEEFRQMQKKDYQEKSSLKITGEETQINTNIELTEKANFDFNNARQGYPKFLSFGGKLAPAFYGNGIEKIADFPMARFVHDAIDQTSDWQVFQEILQNIFVDVKSVADTMTALTDVNNVDENLLPKLSKLINYSYRYDLPHSTNRNIIKRWLHLLNQKGQDKDIINAADFANNPNWVRSTMLVPTPEYPSIEIDRSSRVYYPIDFLFTHDVSKFSDTHRYGNSQRWRDGVVILEVNELTDFTREAVRQTLPAGLKCFFDMVLEMKGDGTGHAVPFKGWWYLLDYVIDIFLRLDEGDHGHDGDHRDIDFIYSGGQCLWPHYEIQKTIAASALPLYGLYPSEQAANFLWTLEMFKKSMPTEVEFTDPNMQKAIDLANAYILNSSDPLLQKTIDFHQLVQESVITPEPVLGYGDGIYDDDFAFGGRKLTPWDTQPGKDSECYSGESISEFSLNKHKEGEVTEFTSLTDAELKRRFLKKETDSFLKNFSPWTDNPVHKISYEVSGFEQKIQNHRMPHYCDDDTTYSGKYAMSGLENEVYVEARHHRIHPSDDTYPVSLIADKYPHSFDYQDCSENAIADYEEFLCIDPIIYKEYMKYRGPIGYVFQGETEHIDYVSPGNPNKDFSHNTLSDWIISDNSEVYRLHEMTLQDIYQDMDGNLLDFAQLILSYNGGRAEYITFKKRDHYRDDYAMPVEIDYLTSYGEIPFGEVLLRERLVTDEWQHNDYPFVQTLSLNSIYKNQTLSDLTLNDLTEAYNYVYRKMMHEVKMDDIINPTREHKNTLAKDSLLFHHRRPFAEKVLDQGVKVLESVAVA